MGLIICTRLRVYYQDRSNFFLHVFNILTLVLFKLGGGVSRDFDSNPGISINLSRDWTSLGWQVWVRARAKTACL